MTLTAGNSFSSCKNPINIRHFGLWGCGFSFYLVNIERDYNFHAYYLRWLPLHLLQSLVITMSLLIADLATVYENEYHTPSK